MLYPVSGNQRWERKYETHVVISSNLAIRKKTRLQSKGTGEALETQ